MTKVLAGHGVACERREQADVVARDAWAEGLRQADGLTGTWYSEWYETHRFSAARLPSE